MQSKAKDVPTYIEEALVERQDTLSRLRELCLTCLTDFEETMEYGGPSYKRKVISLGKGAVRYSKPEHIDFNMVESVLRGTVEWTGPVC